MQPGLNGALFYFLRKIKKAGVLQQAQDKLKTEIAAINEMFIYFKSSSKFVFEDQFCLKIPENCCQKIDFRQKRPS